MIDGFANDIVGSSTTIYAVERGDGVLLRDFTETLKIINTDASINSFTTYYEPYITDLSASATDISGID
jgi:hypothetical protein